MKTAVELSSTKKQLGAAQAEGASLKAENADPRPATQRPRFHSLDGGSAK